MRSSLRTILLAAFLAASAIPALAASFDDVAAMVGAGDYAGARQTVAALPASPEIRQLNERFLEALILRREGKLAEAIAIMREIVNARPQFARVRHELAMTLMMAEDWDSAGYQLDLLAAATDGPLHSIYRGYADAIADSRPWRLQGGFGLLPSTNINNATHDQIVVVGGLPFRPTQTAQSGVGFSASLEGSYRFDVSEQLALTIGGSGAGRIYADHSFDHVVAGTFAELAYEADAWRLGLGLGAERVLAGWQGHRSSLGPQAALKFDLGRAGVINLTGSARHHVYDAGGSDDEFRLGASYGYALSSTMNVVVGLNGTVIKTDMLHNDALGIEPWIGIAAELPLGLVVNARLSYELRDYQAVVPGLASDRDEQRIAASAGVTMKGLSVAGLAPRIEYTYSRNDSLIDIFDVESHSVALTLTKAF